MKYFNRLMILCFCLGCLVACSPAMNGASSEDMIAGADALDTAFVAAFNRGDARAMSELYWNSPDVVTFPPDAMQARGHAAVAASNVAMTSGMPGAKLEIIENHHMPAGDVVIGWGLWRITMPGPQGSPTELLGRYTDVKAERDGKWVYLIDHASAPLPGGP